MIADLSREKLTLQRSQNSVLLYGCSCLSAINEASLLKTTVAVDPNPPVVEKLMAKRNQTQFPECVAVADPTYFRFIKIGQLWARARNCPVLMSLKYAWIRHCRLFICPFFFQFSTAVAL